MTQYDLTQIGGKEQRLFSIDGGQAVSQVQPQNYIYEYKYWYISGSGGLTK